MSLDNLAPGIKAAVLAEALPCSQLFPVKTIGVEFVASTMST